MKRVFIFLLLAFSALATDVEKHPYCKKLEDNPVLAKASLISVKCSEKMEDVKSSHRLISDLNLRPLKESHYSWQIYHLFEIEDEENMQKVRDSYSFISYNFDEIVSTIRNDLLFTTYIGPFNKIEFMLDYTNDKHINTAVKVTDRKMYLVFTFKNTKLNYVRFITLDVFDNDIFVDTLEFFPANDSIRFGKNGQFIDEYLDLFE